MILPARSVRPSLLVLVLAAASCGGGGGGNSPAPAGLSGSWELTLTTQSAGSCSQLAGQQQQFMLQVVQNGDLLTMQSVGGVDLAATLQGDVATLTGSWPRGGGLATAVASDLRVQGDRIAGSVDWTWEGSGGPCAGSDRFDAERIGSRDPLTGTWDLQEDIVSATCNLTGQRFRDVWQVVQDGDRIEVTRLGTGSTARGVLDAAGEVALDFFYDDSNGDPAVDQFQLRFVEDRNPPAVEGDSTWQITGCRGSSDHAGVRTGPLGG